MLKFPPPNCLVICVSKLIFFSYVSTRTRRQSLWHMYRNCNWSDEKERKKKKQKRIINESLNGYSLSVTSTCIFDSLSICHISLVFFLLFFLRRLLLSPLEMVFSLGVKREKMHHVIYTLMHILLQLEREKEKEEDVKVGEELELFFRPILSLALLVSRSLLPFLFRCVRCSSFLQVFPRLETEIWNASANIEWFSRNLWGSNAFLEVREGQLYILQCPSSYSSVEPIAAACQTFRSFFTHSVTLFYMSQWTLLLDFWEMLDAGSLLLKGLFYCGFWHRTFDSGCPGVIGDCYLTSTGMQVLPRKDQRPSSQLIVSVLVFGSVAQSSWPCTISHLDHKVIIRLLLELDTDEV